VAALALVAACAGLLGAGALAGLLFAVGAVHRAGGTTTVITQPVQPSRLGTAELQAATVYARAAPGVVEIRAQVVTEVQTPLGPRRETAVQAGSGIVLDGKGHILTAEHIVEGASSVTVTFQDGVAREADVVGRDSAIDTAVLSVDPSGMTLHPLTLGSVKSLQVGDPLFAIGDPFGYVRSLSSGLVAGLDRTIEAPNGFTVPHVIQTDAALNPGNSGGPLLDAQGRVIGIADQIATGESRDETNTGVGFGVPIDVVTAVLPQLRRGETPAHPYLGVVAADGTPTGAVAQAVRPGSPAAAARVRIGDVILAVGATKVSGVGDLVAAVAARRPGDRVTLTVRRDSKRLALDVTLGRQPVL
jgi:S1-C subfamily serine protease